jgi:hypothetical protein
VRFVNPATFEPVATIKDLTGFCRVEASISATAGSLINFEVWVPRPWNGKLVVAGNGGYGNVPSLNGSTKAPERCHVADGDGQHYQQLWRPAA